MLSLAHSWHCFFTNEVVADSSIYDLQGGLKSLTNHHVCSRGDHYLGHWLRSMPIAQQEYKQQETVHFLGFFLSLIRVVALMLILANFQRSLPALLLEEQHYSLTFQHKEEEINQVQVEPTLAL